MIIKIYSTDPNLSYILSKNPASGLFYKPIRAGFILGKFLDNNTYALAYEESKGSDSFDKEGGYLQYRKYCDPMVALSILKTLSCLTQDKYKEYQSEGSTNNIHIPCIDLNNVDPKMFTCPGFVVHTFPLEDSDLHDLCIYSQWSLIDTLRYLSLMLFMSTIRQRDYYDLGQLKSYLRLLSTLPNVPFLVRHRFRGIIEFSYIPKVISLLNTSDIKLSPIGNMESQRKAFVSNYIKYKSVLDIGCDTGKFIKASNCTDYIGVDVNTHALHKAELRANDYSVDAKFFIDYKVALESLKEPTTVLLIEVIEHIPYDEMTVLLSIVRSNPYVKQLLLSTPNKDFNTYLNMSESDVRHNDHLFELTEEQFRQVCGEPVKFGDSYKGINMTLYLNEEYNNG